MSRYFAVLTMTVFLSSLPIDAAERRVTVSGWVSDAACGAQHVNTSSGDCIRKCMRGGAAIGHPEWKPQAMVLVDDSDRGLWTVSNPKLLLSHEGQHVSVVVRPNRKQKSVQVLELLPAEVSPK